MNPCQCGCGGDAGIVPETNREMGYVKGNPLRFIRGHENRGRHGWKDAGIRFYAKVEKVQFGCWRWRGSVDLHGYGQMRIAGELMRAHRISWILHHGPIPIGLHVLHECDNPPCSNPEHLFLGTHKDNMRDAALKGRIKLPDNTGDRNATRLHPEIVRGERNGNSKLTAAQVARIRELRFMGSTYAQIGAEFGVTLQNIYQIISGKSWKHLK